MEIRNGTKDKTTTKAQVQNNKDDSYNISYFAKETGKCNVLLKLNVQHIHDSPFAVQGRARHFRPVLSFGQRGSAAGMLSKPWEVAVNERDENVVQQSPAVQ